MAILSGFNIANFRSSFSRGEPQRTTQFEAILVPPAVILAAGAATGFTQVAIGGAISSNSGTGIAATALDFRLRCSAINLPGKNISTIDFAQTIGPNIKIANGSNFDRLQLEVIMSQTGLERQLIAGWMEYIQATAINSMDVAYYDDYTGNLILNVYSSDGSIAQLVNITNCFPVSISSVQFSWSGTDRIASFIVEMPFETMQVVAPNQLPSGAFDILPIGAIQNAVTGAVTDVGSAIVAGLNGNV